MWINSIFSHSSDIFTYYVNLKQMFAQLAETPKHNLKWIMLRQAWTKPSAGVCLLRGHFTR